MLKDIFSISGKPGLYKAVSRTPHVTVLEPLQGGKRVPAYSTTKTTALENVGVSTNAEDISLKEIFKRIFEKENGGAAPSYKGESNDIVRYIEEIIPEYDHVKVHLSDMKKILQWYNALQEHGLLIFNDEEQPQETPAETETPAGE
ncbi:MAG: DUF5606 domain-containing protein [Odoribacteraceae bacterium]|jgi:hypothetical protein|nr:DUF5606 domain-containing protein [Odoribacteraceae bacterium]